MDSNHRRLSQLSYSQPHLATLVTAHRIMNSYNLFDGKGITFAGDYNTFSYFFLKNLSIYHVGRISL